MRGTRGFILADAMVAALLVSLTAAAVFPLIGQLALCLGTSSLQTAVADEAESLLARERLLARSILNQSGAPAAGGSRTVVVGGQAFDITLLEEVVPECPSLQLWTVVVAPRRRRTGLFATTGVRFLTASYDPF